MSRVTSEVNSILEAMREVTKSASSDYKTQQLVATGYMQALTDFGIWKDGTQTIGCMCNSVKDMKQDIRDYFFGKTEPF